MKVILPLSLLLLLGGCAALVPDSVRPELEHISHATQHAPFTSHPTNYGANIASLIVHWDVSRNTYFEVAEGVDLDRRWGNYSCGEIIGPREQFTARVGYVLEIKK